MASDIVSPSFSPAAEPGELTPATRDITAGSSTVTAAVKELFRRLPAGPARELERIRRALLQSEGTGYAGSGDQPPEPARAALDLLTAELQRLSQRCPTVQEVLTPGQPHPLSQEKT